MALGQWAGLEGRAWPCQGAAARGPAIGWPRWQSQERDANSVPPWLWALLGICPFHRSFTEQDPTPESVGNGGRVPEEGVPCG